MAIRGTSDRKPPQGKRDTVKCGMCNEPVGKIPHPMYLPKEEEWDISKTKPEHFVQKIVCSTCNDKLRDSAWYMETIFKPMRKLDKLAMHGNMAEPLRGH